MGKQGKSKAKQGGQGGTTRSAPYAKKARVEVTFEGVPPSKPAKSSKPPTATLTPNGKGNGKGKGKADPIPSSTTTTSTASNLPAQSQPSSSLFIIIAGTYEKNLYGLEGSYPSTSTSTSAPTLKPIFIFPAHLACVKAVAASPGGKWLATGSEDEFVKVWDLRRRKEVGSLSQHSGSITSVHFPCPSHLITTSEDSTLSLFRTSDWALLKSLKGHSGRVNHVDVHPTGRVALSVGKDMTLKMWDLMRGRGAASLPLGSEAEMVKFSPSGTHFAVLIPKKIQIYSLTLKLLRTLSTKSRFNTLLWALVPAALPADEEELPEEVEVLCVGTEKGVIEVNRVVIGDTSEVVDAANEGGEEDTVEEGKEVGAEVDLLGRLVGHSNRVKSISALPFIIPPAAGSSDGPRKTVLLTSVSSDGLVNLYDLQQVFNPSSKPSVELEIQPVASYDTKGSRLTCVFLADGKAASAVAKAPQSHVKQEDEADESDETDEDDVMAEDGADLYDSAQENDTSVPGNEDGVEVEFEDEEEDEEEAEEEGEGEFED